MSQPAMSSEYLNTQRANVLQAPTVAPMRKYLTPPGQVGGMIQPANHVEYHFHITPEQAATMLPQARTPMISRNDPAGYADMP